MKIGSSVALIVLGAVLFFAVQDTVPGVDLTMIGAILAIAGIIGLVVTLIASRNMNRPLNRTSETRTLDDPASGETIRRTEVRED